MDLSDISTDLISDRYWEVKAERKAKQAEEKELLNELNRRNSLPEIPSFTSYERPLLTTQNKIDLGHFLEQVRTPGEIIDFVEELSKKGQR